MLLWDYSEGGDCMDYETSCMYCRFVRWDTNCHCWECTLTGAELSTSEDGEELYELSCTEFKG